MQTPYEKNIAAGMSPLRAFLSEATCGEACWEAREDVCHCSCGGENHGCMRSADGVRPARTSRIDGYMYELKGVGDVYADANAINSQTTKHVKVGNWERDYPWEVTDKGAPARVKTATIDQINRWPELASFRCEPWEVWKKSHPDAAYINYPLFDRPRLLWVRV